MKKALLLTVLTFLSACAFDPMPDPVMLDYSNYERIHLDVKDLRIVNRAQNKPEWPPYVGHKFAPSLTDALYRLAGDRLQAVGETGTAKLVIREASVIEQAIETSTEWERIFTREQASKYIGRAEVSLEAFAPRGAMNVATAHAVHSVTLPEDPSEAEKYRAYTKLMENLIANLNIQLEKGIRQHMVRFIVPEPAAAELPPIDMPPIQWTPPQTAPLNAPLTP